MYTLAVSSGPLQQEIRVLSVAAISCAVQTQTSDRKVYRSYFDLSSHATLWYPRRVHRAVHNIPIFYVVLATLRLGRLRYTVVCIRSDWNANVSERKSMRDREREKCKERDWGKTNKALNSLFLLVSGTPDQIIYLLFSDRPQRATASTDTIAHKSFIHLKRNNFV